MKRLLVVALAASSVCIMLGIGVGDGDEGVDLQGGLSVDGDVGLEGDGAMGNRGGGAVVVYLDHTFAPNASHPTCSVAEDCVFQVTFGADGSVVAVEGDGTAVAITEGSGLESVLSPSDAYSALDVDTAEAPRLATPADLSGFWGAPHTILFAGYSTQNTDATFAYHFDHFNGGNGGYARQEGSTIRCAWGRSGASPASVTRAGQTMRDAFGLMACRKNGSGAASTYDVVTNLFAETATAWAYDPGDPTTAGFWIGRRTAASQFPLRGQVASFTVYSAAKTTAFIQAATRRAQYDPAFASGGLVEDSGTWYTAQQYARDTQGYIIPRRALVYVDGIFGIPTEDGYTNKWATDPLDADSWSDVGTPTITQNAASGPASRWKNTATTDLVVDDDNTGWEGLQSASLGTAAGDYAVACILANGTSGTVRDKVRLVITSSGAGGATCDLDMEDDCEAEGVSGYYRCFCAGEVTGTPVNVYGQVLVGAADSDTGSILVDHCQGQAQGFVSSPSFTTGGAGGNAPFVDNVEVDTWWSGDPSTGGEIEWVQFFNKGSDEGENQYFLDVSDHETAGGSAQHAMLLYRLVSSSGACTAGHLCFQHYDSGCAAADYTTLSTSTFSITARTWYVFRTKWDASGNTWIYANTCADKDTCTATTLVGSGTGKCVTNVDPDRAHLGRRWSGDWPIDGYTYRLKVSG